VLLALLSSNVVGDGFRHRYSELIRCREYEVGEPGSFDQATIETPCVKDLETVRGVSAIQTCGDGGRETVK
jgi:hypothetical protein